MLHYHDLFTNCYYIATDRGHREWPLFKIHRDSHAQNGHAIRRCGYPMTETPTLTSARTHPLPARDARGPFAARAGSAVQTPRTARVRTLPARDARGRFVALSHHARSELVRPVRRRLPNRWRVTGGAPIGDRARRAPTRDRARAASSVRPLAVAEHAPDPDRDHRVGLVRAPPPAAASVMPREAIPRRHARADPRAADRSLLRAIARARL